MRRNLSNSNPNCLCSCPNSFPLPALIHAAVAVSAVIPVVPVPSFLLAPSILPLVSAAAFSNPGLNNTWQQLQHPVLPYRLQLISQVLWSVLCDPPWDFQRCPCSLCSRNTHICIQKKWTISFHQLKKRRCQVSKRHCNRAVISLKQNKM